MKRFLIFLVMYPVLGLLVFMATDPESRRVFLDMVSWFLGVAYLFGSVPALLSAVTDWKLSAKPAYLGLGGTALAGAAALVAELAASPFQEILGSATGLFMISLIGAVPAAACAWFARTIGTQRMPVKIEGATRL